MEFHWLSTVLLAHCFFFRGHLANISRCGETTVAYSSYNHGSDDLVRADIRQMPWMASLGYYDDDLKWIHECGGSLVTQSHVLSAAHCFVGIKNNGSFYNPTKKGYSFRLGVTDLTKSDSYSVDRLVDRIFLHPNYTTGKSYYDVGIAITDKPVEFTDHVRPICLPLHPVDEEDYLDGSLVTLAGWGNFFSRNGSYIETPTDLKLINLRVLSKSECDIQFSKERLEKFGLARIEIFIKLRQIDRGFSGPSVACVANPFKVENSCEGDSGSPVVRRVDETSRDQSFYVQEFIVSAGVDCRLPATIYVRITDKEILPWIHLVTDTSPLLMVVGGLDANGVTDSVELVSSSVDDNCATSISPITGAAAQGLIGKYSREAAIVCGGKNGRFLSRNCYELNSESNRWDSFAPMSNERYDAGAVLNENDDIWILGGENVPDKQFSTTEFYEYLPGRKGAWKIGVPLASDLRDTGINSHCAVRINTTFTLIMGGYVRIRELYDPLTEPLQPTELPLDLLEAGADIRTGIEDYQIGDIYELDFAWLYNGLSWKTVSSMNQIRVRPACVNFVRPDGKWGILVAGGCDKVCDHPEAKALVTTELYDPETDTWSKAADLPMPIHSAKLELLEGLPTLIGGYNHQTKSFNDVIYQYKPETGEWITSTERLKVPRANAAVFQVPRHISDKCVHVATLS